MTHRELTNFIKKMHEMGATDILVGNVRVQFPPAPQPIDAQAALDARVQRAIDDIHEEKMDANEIEDAESAKRAAAKATKLNYLHSG